MYNEGVVLSRVDQQVPFLLSVLRGNTRSVKAYLLCPPSYHLKIVRKKQHQCFEGFLGVVYENEKHEWTCQ